jgi:hypothetical protein
VLDVASHGSKVMVKVCHNLQPLAVACRLIFVTVLHSQVLDVASHGSKVMVKVRHNLLVRPFHMAKHAVPALATELLTVPLIVNSGGLWPPC